MCVLEQTNFEKYLYFPNRPLRKVCPSCVSVVTRQFRIFPSVCRFRQGTTKDTMNALQNAMLSLVNLLSSDDNIGNTQGTADKLLDCAELMKEIDPDAAIDDIVNSFLGCHSLILQMKKKTQEQHAEMDIMLKRLSMLKNTHQMRMKRLKNLKLRKVKRTKKVRRPMQRQTFEETDSV